MGKIIKMKWEIKDGVFSNMDLDPQNNYFFSVDIASWNELKWQKALGNIVSLPPPQV